MAKRTKKKVTVSLSDDTAQKTVFEWKTTRPALIAAVCIAFLVLAVGVYLLISYTPLHYAVPGYPTESSRRTAMENLVKMDSLERVMNMWALQVENIRRISEGEAPLSPDSLSAGRSGEAVANRNIYASQDSLLRADVLRRELFNPSERQGEVHISQIEGLLFFTPVKGLLTKDFEAGLNHPYVDVAATEGTMVYSVLDGTVISASQNNDRGYTIEIMHGNDIVSIYKHCERLLKRAGDKVKAGTPVAVVGGTENGGSHIRFELWHAGEAIDPTLYIKF